MENNFIASEKDLGQGIISEILIPINEDYVACSRAVHSLLNEGWAFNGFTLEGCHKIYLKRIWRA